MDGCIHRQFCSLFFLLANTSTVRKLVSSEFGFLLSFHMSHVLAVYPLISVIVPFPEPLLSHSGFLQLGKGRSISAHPGPYVIVCRFLTCSRHLSIALGVNTRTPSELKSIPTGWCCHHWLNYGDGVGCFACFPPNMTSGICSKEFNLQSGWTALGRILVSPLHLGDGNCRAHWDPQSSRLFLDTSPDLFLHSFMSQRSEVNLFSHLHHRVWKTQRWEKWLNPFWNKASCLTCKAKVRSHSFSRPHYWRPGDVVERKSAEQSFQMHQHIKTLRFRRIQRFSYMGKRSFSVHSPLSVS